MVKCELRLLIIGFLLSLQFLIRQFCTVPNSHSRMWIRRRSWSCDELAGTLAVRV